MDDQLNVILNMARMSMSPVDCRPYVIKMPKGWKPARRLCDMTVRERHERHHTRAEWRRIYNGLVKTGMVKTTFHDFITRRRRSGFVIPTKRGGVK